MYSSQLRNVLDERIVEREQAAIAQLHNRDSGEGFRHRGPVIRRVIVDGLGLALATVVVVQHHFAIADEDETTANDSVATQAFFIERLDFLRSGWRLILSNERSCEGDDCDDESAHHVARIVWDGAPWDLCGNRPCVISSIWYRSCTSRYRVAGILRSCRSLAEACLHVFLCGECSRRRQTVLNRFQRWREATAMAPSQHLAKAVRRPLCLSPRCHHS